MTEPDLEQNWQNVTEAIGRLATQNLGRPGVMTGYVIMIATSRFDDDGDMCHAYDYAVMPDTDLIRAVGLTELCSRLMHRHIDSAAIEEDD